MDLVAAVRCDYCSERTTTKAHYRGGFHLDAPEGWVVFATGMAICSACQHRQDPVVHVMQAGVTLCGITEIPANWPSNWVSVAQKEFHSQVTCPECLKALSEFD